jgi:hypothetical protein
MRTTPNFKKPFALHFIVFLFFAFPLYSNCLPKIALFFISDAE